jgi:twitching motility two-component system response regulator PilH
MCFMSINKILIVDDSPTELAHIQSIISDAGCLVLTATNGQEALTKAKAEKPDLIFLDIVMPDQDGFSTCRKLAGDAATKDIPVVFVTSKNQKADRVWAQMQGAKGYITKPYSSNEIIDQIKALQ